MSYNTDPDRAARRHPGPIIAIVLALLVAAAAAFWWMGSDPKAHDDVSRVPAAPDAQVVPAAPAPAAPSN